MTDFVISEDDMLWWESGKPFSKYERKMMCDKIRSHPLSDELESAYKNGFNDGQAEGMSTPCEEQGCTDIENCDEICLHTRIYSPAQFVMQCDIIRKAEQKRVLEVVDIECQEIQSRIESSAMGNPLSERERGRIIGILDIRVKLESLRGEP